jgi:hypothetical protein
MFFCFEVAFFKKSTKKTNVDSKKSIITACKIFMIKDYINGYLKRVVYLFVT